MRLMEPGPLPMVAGPCLRHCVQSREILEPKYGFPNQSITKRRKKPLDSKVVANCKTFHGNEDMQTFYIFSNANIYFSYVQFIYSIVYLVVFQVHSNNHKSATMFQQHIYMSPTPIMCMERAWISSPQLSMRLGCTVSEWLQL